MKTRQISSKYRLRLVFTKRVKLEILFLEKKDMCVCVIFFISNIIISLVFTFGVSLKQIFKTYLLKIFLDNSIEGFWSKK